MPDGHVLILDQGGHSSRAVVFDEKGQVVASAACSLNIENRSGGFVEQDPQAIIRSLQNCLQQLQANLTEKQRGKIHKAGLIVQRSSFLACEKKLMQPITPVISWQDTRNSQWLAQQNLDIAHLHQITGLRVNAHYGASKMRWLLEHDADVQKAAKENRLVFVPLSAYIAAELTQAASYRVDPVIAQRTLLYDIQKQQWSDELLQRFTIARGQLPEVVSSDTLIGNITLGEASIPLCLVGGDQSFLPLACGFAALAGSAFVNVGTGAFIQCLMPPHRVPQALLSSSMAVTQQQPLFVAEGTVNAAASALDWFWQSSGHNPGYEDLERLLENTETEMVFINTLAGTGSPWWLPKQEPLFIGAGSWQQQCAAVVESVLFALVENLQQLLQAGAAIEQLIISGGLAQSSAFCRKLAALAGLRVLRPEDHEASARGAAMFLLNSAQSDLLQSADVFQPQNDTALQQRFLTHSRTMWQLSESC